MGAWSDFTNFTPSTNQIPVAALLSPIGNATVGTLTPTLQFSYSDPDGDSQSGYQVQVRRYTDQVMLWDPGQQAGAVTSVALFSVAGFRMAPAVVRVQTVLSDMTANAPHARAVVITEAAAGEPPTAAWPGALVAAETEAALDAALGAANETGAPFLLVAGSLYLAGLVRPFLRSRGRRLADPWELLP